MVLIASTSAQIDADEAALAPLLQPPNIWYGRMGGEKTTSSFHNMHNSRQGGASGADFKTPKTMEKAKRIDVTSRFVFPLAFASFNVVYWTHYLSKAQLEYEASVLGLK